MSLNRPCVFNGLAKTWPAFKKWRYEQSDGYKYLANLINKKELEVFIDPEPEFESNEFDGYSFDKSFATKMQYKPNYLDAMT